MEFDGTEFSSKDFEVSGRERITAEYIRNLSLDSFFKPMFERQLFIAQRPIYGIYSSVVGEFHKLGNLEEQGFELSTAKSYEGEWPSISTRPSARKLGEIYDGKMYVGKPTAHCLAVAKEMRKKPVYPKGYCRGPMHSLYPGFD